ncbi:MotA/TolQ/ExbB proton channel family protein [Vibrio viridaestus]|uniref:Flagellar motor protein MotA n=1 Tax=Vibrio viridaestus TaxID=2487322 RepID=A0A3N9TJK5_9VIBR|nr:MotA/TolQ/ExbB proton channel family protein [Vibrio viridaestus]RQW63745.1 flagellar motor protein MotA [Vibrio viridaestus]
MFHGMTIGILHHIVGWLLYPVLVALAVCIILILWELGLFIGERFGALSKLSHLELLTVESYAAKRLERVDLLARSGPILGLMGTLIPLGPGLAALSNGELSQLSTAMTVAFDTTVLGLTIGLVGYILGRVRRRWYELLLLSMEDALEERVNNETITAS